MIEVVAFSSWTADDGPPGAALLGARQRRRASLLTRVAAEVLGKLVERAAVDASRLATVYATSHGEIGVTVELLGMMHEDDGALSPLRFSGSVHNAAAGHLSIATGNHAFSTTVTAGRDTVAMGLLEAVAAVERIDTEVALVVAEEPVPAPLSPTEGYDALAGALLLRRGDGRARRIDGPRRERLVTAPEAMPASIAHNPCAPILRLIAALQRPDASRVWLIAAGEGGAERAWCVDVAGATP